MGIFIEDERYESQMPDGTVVWTTKGQILRVLRYYKQQCTEIIEKGERQIKNTPRVLTAWSFEEAMQIIESQQNRKERIKKAKKLLEDVNNCISKIAQASTSKNGAEPSEPQKQ